MGRFHAGRNDRQNDMNVRPKDVVYAVRRLSDGAIKFGKAQTLSNRLSHLRREHGEIELLAITHGYTERERQIHEMFESFCIRLEHLYMNRKKLYYRTPLKTEWYRPDPVILDWINENMDVGTRKYTPRQRKPLPPAAHSETEIAS